MKINFGIFSLSLLTYPKQLGYLYGMNKEKDIQAGERTQEIIGAMQSCPFCGSRNNVCEPLVGGFVVNCQDCGGGCGTCHSEEAAIKEWNKRHDAKLIAAAPDLARELQKLYHAALKHSHIFANELGSFWAVDVSRAIEKAFPDRRHEIRIS